MSTHQPNACVLIVDDDEVIREFVAAVLGATGWQVIAVADAVGAAEHATACDMILMDLELGRARGEAVTAALREMGVHIPILAFSATRIDDRDALLAHGFDDVLAKPCSPDTLLAAARRWLPLDLPEATARLETVFGEDRLRPMLVQLRELLAEALQRSHDVALAHRIAGVAGTLGFASLGAAWLAASEAQPGAAMRARIETRRALATLDRRLAVAP